MKHTSSPSFRRHLRRLAAIAGGAVLGLGTVLAIAAPASAHTGYLDGKGDCATDTGWTATITLTHDWESDGAEVDSVKVTPDNMNLTLVGIEKGTKLAEAGQDGDTVTGTVEVPAGIDRIYVEIWLTWGDGYPWEGGPQEVMKYVYPDKDCPAPPPTTAPPPSPSPSPSPSASSPVPPPAESPSPSPVPGGGGGGPSLPTTGASIYTAVGIAAVLLAVGTGLFFFFRRRRIHFTA